VTNDSDVTLSAEVAVGVAILYVKCVVSVLLDQVPASSAANGGEAQGARPLRNLRNFLSQIAGISSVKYRRCAGRWGLLADYSPGVPITQRQRQLHAWSMCRSYSTEYVRQGSVI